MLHYYLPFCFFASKRKKSNKKKNEEIELVKKNTETVKEIDGKISAILDKTASIRNRLNVQYKDSLGFYGKDYQVMTTEEKMNLGNLVNNTKSLSALFNEKVE